MINRAFSALGRNLSLILIPVAMDTVAFILGLMTTGFFGQSKFTFKLSLGVGMPSIADVLDQNILVNGINFDLGGGPGLLGITLLLFVLFVIGGAFVEAGFIGLIYQLASKAQCPTVEAFIYYAQKFWLRLLGLRLIVLLVTFLSILVAVPFMTLGIIASMIIFIVLRVKYIYWEFTLISEDLGLFEAFSRSRQHYENRPSELSSVLISIFVANLLAAMILNLLWTPLVILIGIFAYNYIATGLQLALMFTKPGLTDLSA